MPLDATLFEMDTDAGGNLIHHPKLFPVKSPEIRLQRENKINRFSPRLPSPSPHRPAPPGRACANVMSVHFSGCHRVKYHHSLMWSAPFCSREETIHFTGSWQMPMFEVPIALAKQIQENPW